MNNIITNNNDLCQQACAGLYNVDDPEIGLNIVDLGLVYELNFKEVEKIVTLVMTLTTQFCPMGDSIQSNARQALEEALPHWSIDIDLTFEPPWDTSKISPEGQEFLGYN